MDFVNKIGTSLYMGGFVLVGDTDYPMIVLRPGVEYKPGIRSDEILDLMPIKHGEFELYATNPEQFKQIIRQMDLVETEITDEWGSKVIVRKTQRSGDTRVTWEVYRRDNFTCRYCGVEGGENGATLSYDHVRLWEEGGEWSVENGITACRKCNKQRGNTSYRDWINGPIYARKSIYLSPPIRALNEGLVSLYESFPRRTSKRGRR